MAITSVAENGPVAAEAPLLDDVVRGSVGFNGLPSRRAKPGCWRSASLIIGVEVAERFAYNGISSNLVSYLTGPLGQSTATAAENVNAWNGSAMLLPLLGAFLADSFLGRYRMIIVASLLYILGLGLISLSASLHSFNCKHGTNDLPCYPSLLEVIVFFFSLYLVAFAEGGHRPCVQAFGADQFDEEDEKECKAKSSFFNWWYFASNGGVLVALLMLNYIQENISWELGFGIPCIIMCLALFIFLLGSKTYRFQINGDNRNPLTRISHVFIKAARNWQATPTEEGQAEFEFLDKALLAQNSTKDDDKMCSIHDVNDAKAILRLVPIWCTCLGYAIVFSQTSTLFTKQGAAMDRHITRSFQIPAASLQVLIYLSIIVFIPIYDRILVPAARAITRKHAGITMLQRIGTGIVLSFLSMVTAALVERQRLAIAVEHGLVGEPMPTVPMSVWWLAPQYLLFGVADVFTMVGLQEFFYDQVPGEVKSLGLALYLSIFGIGNFLSSFLISVIEKATSGDGHESWFSDNLNRAHIDYFYWVMAGISALTILAFVYFARSYIYRRNGQT